MAGSNRQPLACKASALPIELIPRVYYGAPERTRTSNHLIRSQGLYPIELQMHHGAEYKT